MKDHYCDIEELFTEMSERTTVQKHTLMEHLLSSTRGWTANQLIKQLGSKARSQATIHRNLTNLKESGIIQVALEDAGQTVYERQNDKHHDHMKCQKCGAYNCVPCAVPKPKLKERVKITSHSLLYQGLCSKCI